MKATWVLKRGCWESLFQRSKQKLGKDKAKKNNKENKDKNVFEKKGVDGQKAKKEF